MIAARGLTKRYGARRALDAVTFTAPDGAITGLLGANGAGKTTTFRILSGLLRADSGDVRLAGRDDRTATLGVLPHSHGVYGRLTVREHVRYFAELRGVPPGQLGQRVAELIDQLGLDAAADAPARTLSEGQRVKLLLAGAMVHEPDNLILDEPTSGLDVVSTRALHARLRALRDRGACVLFSSHVMSEVASLCDTVVMLVDGVVAAAGTPSALLARYGAGSLDDLFVSLSADGPVDGGC
jgi:sodium transport system ATP-binding protein